MESQCLLLLQSLQCSVLLVTCPLSSASSKSYCPYRLLTVRQLHHIGSTDRGLYRVHQFSKVEMFVVSTPEQSEAILEELCLIEEEIFQELGLHYKVLVRHLPWSMLCLRSMDGKR